MAGVVLASNGKHMVRTPSTATLPGGKGSTPLAQAAKTTRTRATPATGEPVSTFCAAEATGDKHHFLYAYVQPLTELFFLCANTPRGATMEGLCAPLGPPESPVTRAVAGHKLLDAFVSGWDPGESGINDNQVGG